MLIVAAKVLLTPILLVASMLAARKWGPVVGGWLLGLPLVSGPVSMFLFVEHGPRFAENAARGALLGLVAAGAFCVCYAFAARRLPWWSSLATAYAVCFGAIWMLSLVHLGIGWTLVLVLTTLFLLARVIHAPESVEPVPTPRVTGMLARMAIASTIVMLLTASAGVLGSQAAGLLAPLPVLAAIMTASSHRRSGAGAANGLLRGAVVGSWGGAAFFAVVVALIGIVGPVPTYLGATVAALLVAAIAMRVSARTEHMFSLQALRTLRA